MDETLEAVSLLLLEDLLDAVNSLDAHPSLMERGGPIQPPVDPPYGAVYKDLGVDVRVLALISAATKTETDRRNLLLTYFTVLVINAESCLPICMEDCYFPLLSLWKKYKDKDLLMAAMISLLYIHPELKKASVGFKQIIEETKECGMTIYRALLLATEQFSNKETQFPPACCFLSSLPETILEQFIGEGWETYKETYIFYQRDSISNDITIF